MFKHIIAMIAIPLMAATGCYQPSKNVELAAPTIIAGLEVDEVEVNGDKPKWLKIDPGEYSPLMSELVRVADFPVRPGKRVVRYVLISFPPVSAEGEVTRGPLNQEVIDEIKRRGFTLPDRAVTETVLDHLQKEIADGALIMGISGVTAAPDTVAFVEEDARGRALGLGVLRAKSPDYTKFVAVVNE